MGAKRLAGSRARVTQGGFAVVGFREVTEVKPLPVRASGERLNELPS